MAKGGSVSVFVCEECDREYTAKAALMSHKRSHSADREFEVVDLRVVQPRSKRSDKSPRPCCREGCPNLRRRGRGHRYCSDACRRAVNLAIKRQDGSAQRIQSPEEFRSRRLWRNYRMTLADVDAKFIEQGSICDMCGSEDPRSPNGWHIDHDHNCCDGPRSCGSCIRGILCGYCNMRILPVVEGEYLGIALAYLAKWQRREAA